MFISRVGAAPSGQNFGMKVKQYSRIENPGNPVLTQGRQILQNLAPNSKSTITIYGVKGRDTIHGWIEPDPAMKSRINSLANTSSTERNSLDRSEFKVSLHALKDPEAREQFEKKTLLGYDKWVGVHIKPVTSKKS